MPLTQVCVTKEPCFCRSRAPRRNRAGEWEKMSHVTHMNESSIYSYEAVSRGTRMNHEMEWVAKLSGLLICVRLLICLT